MTRPYPYYPAKAAPGKLAGTEKLVELCGRRWKTKNLGTWVVRDMRGKPGVLSVHATGRAMDIGYTDRKDVMAAIRWFVTYNTALGVTLINDYQFGQYGRTWMCDRQDWKIHQSDVLGSRGNWFHVELDSWAADDAAGIEKIWRSLPR